jgi:hypothetical protein
MTDLNPLAHPFGSSLSSQLNASWVVKQRSGTRSPDELKRPTPLPLRIAEFGLDDGRNVADGARHQPTICPAPDGVLRPG